MTISILGCGWLGLPLAEALINDGHTVKGSTTREEKLEILSKKGIDSFLIELTPDLACPDCDSFWESDLLVLNIPPGRGCENVIEYHTLQIRAVIRRLHDSPNSRVIYASSTSVYPERPGIVEENDAIPGDAGRDSGNALLQAEELLMSRDFFNTTILRFGGLYGYNRHPAQYLAGRTDLGKAKAPVNLIHRDDCIGIIREVIRQEIKGKIFNCVSDGHPPRDIYYRAAADQLGLEPPKFKETEVEEKDYKIVSNRRLKDVTGYSFIYPNPMNLDGLNS